MLAALLGATAGRAADAPRPAPEQAPLVREIFVPFADLSALLENQPRRVMLSREDYEELLAKARRAPEERAPRPFAVLSAETTAAVAEDRARLTTAVLIEVLEDGVHAVPLDLGGVGLREAALDGKPAPVGRAPGGPLTLFVEGKGARRLVLEMTAPVQTTAAQQTLSFRLPHAPAARMELTVPGDVEIKTGAAVASRAVDEAADVTRFEIVPRAGDTTLVMTLNSRLARQDRVVMARSVVAFEVTQAYEQLHARASMEVLHRAAGDFRFALPDGFEVTHVSSPHLARWSVEQDGPRRVLDVKLREQTTETVALDVVAVRAPARLDGWTAPRLEPLDVAGHASVLALLVEDRLQAASLAPAGLVRVDLPADPAQMRRLLPESVGAGMAPAPGAPLLKPVAMYYAPQADYALAGRFEKLPARLAVTSNLLMVLGARRQEAAGGFALLPEIETLYGVEFSVPAGWHVDAVTGAAGQPVPFEHYAAAEGPGKVRVRLAQGVAPGETFHLGFHAVSVPEGWLGPWTARQADLPVFTVAGATRDQGAVGVACLDDIAVRLESLEGLVPLAESEKPRFRLEGVPTNLAYRYEGRVPHKAVFAVERTRPRVTARTFSFFRVTPDALLGRYELIYDVEEAGAQTLTLLAPPDVPAALSIRALSDPDQKEAVRLKEYESSPAEGATRWTVHLAEPRRGRVRLAVDFQKALSAEKSGRIALPLVRAEGFGPDPADRVLYQTGMVAVEGSAELDVQIKTGARRVHVGELADADYQPGRRLLGAYSFSGEPPEVVATVSRQPGHPVYPAIVQRARLDTALSAAGVSQTAAEFALRTKSLFLEVTLPPGSKLWSAELDDRPIKPQTEGSGRVLVGLSAAAEGGVVKLLLVYETPVRPVGMTGRVEMAAPELLLRAEAGAPPERVPLADLEWEVHLPRGYQAIASDGTLVPTDLHRPMPAALMVAGGLAAAFYHGGGGTPGPGYWSPVRAAREAARGALTVDRSKSMMAPAEAEAPPQAAPHYMQDDVDYAKEVKEQFPAGREGRPERKPDAEKPEEKPAERPVEGYRAPAKGKYAYDLTGARSLKIKLGLKDEDFGERVVLQGLGEESLVGLTLANRPRLATLGLALAIVVFLAGAFKTNRTAGAKARFILVVGAAATLLPVFPGCEVTALPADMVVFAAAALVPYYLAAGLVKRLARQACRCCAGAGPKQACAAGVALLMSAALVQTSLAAQPPLVQLVDPPLPPVTVPEDAVIVPYDPDSETGVRDARKLMVPYAKYVELWDRAYPDKRLDQKAPPASYGLAGAAYTVRLAGEESLQFDGRVAIDVFTDEFASVPLGLDGGVLTRAELDGRPAQISVPLPDPAGPPAPQAELPPGKFVLLQVQGKGRHELVVSVRVRLERRGGWRVAAAALPAAPAASLAVTVPEPQTEVRLEEVPDRTSYDTQQPDQRIDTALGAAGRVRVEWRPRVTEGLIDRGLTVQSTARLDVQEDGLTVAWTAAFSFPRAQRDRFTLGVPGEYLVQKVEGNNVRGWSVRGDASGQTVEVSLLKTAKDAESVTLRLWRKGPVGEGDLAEFDAPIVAVPEAARQTGTLAVRRSPLLDVQTVRAEGVTRTDLAAPAPGAPAAEKDESQLGIRPYQAYGFLGVPFGLRLSARPAAARVRAEVQTQLQIAQIEQVLRACIVLDVQGRPVHRVEVFLPEGLSQETVAAPGRFEWTIREEGGRRLLCVSFGEGQSGALKLLVEGKMPGAKEGDSVPVPRLEVRGTESQRGEVAVQTDAAVRPALRDAKNVETVLLGELASWLRDPKQRAATRLALRCEGPDYAGTLALSAEQPEVTCTTISNARVTERAVEETVLLDFRIRKAGVREFAFLLPALPQGQQWRVRVPELRQQTFAPAPDHMVRVRLELQVEKTGQVMVQALNDRLLVPGAEYEVPVPVVETPAGWRVERQFVALQGRGRDEVVPGKLQGLEPLGREQRDWKTLEGYGLGGITQAYAAAPGAGRPRLALSTRRREAVETAEAGILLAATVLVMDSSGAYRAQVSYTVFNSTEQFLQVALPEGARLWTARVDGQPVKPVETPPGAVPAGDPRTRVRLPLLKTDAGGLPYEVRVVYGGRTDPPGALRRTRFPLAAAENIRAEQSSARLCLPEDSHWYDFRGTMGLVEDEGSLAAQAVGVTNKVLERLLQTSRGSDEWSKAQAANNLKQLGLATLDLGRTYGDHARNVELQGQLERNAALSQEAQQQLFQYEAAPAQQFDLDNRSKLSGAYLRQDSFAVRNTVQGLGGNWDADSLLRQPPRAQAGVRFNDAWLDANGLLSPAATPGEKPRDDLLDTTGGFQGAGLDGRGRGKGRLLLDDPGKKPSSGEQPQAAELGNVELRTQVQSQLPTFGDAAGLDDAKKDTITRYKERLSEQQAARQADLSKSIDRIVQHDAFAPSLAEEREAQRQSVPKLQAEVGRLHGARGDLANEAVMSLERVEARSLVTAADSPAVTLWNGGERALLGPGVDGPGPAAWLGGVPRGLASLDVTLPQRGAVYLFTTPGGDCEIVARSVPAHSVRRVLQAAATVLVVLLALGAARLGRGCAPRCPGARALSTVLIVLGLLSLLAGVFPIYGLIAVLAGIGMKVYRRLVAQVSNLP